MKYTIILLLFAALFLYSCQNQVVETESPVVEQVEQNTTVVVPSCEDNDPCTEGTFNQNLGRCEYTRLEYCCGDSVCTESERCDTAVHRTICPQDCSKLCPAFITISDFECTGGCTTIDNGYQIKGYARIETVLENIGELSSGEISSKLVCRNSAGGIMVDPAVRTVNGFTVSDHFDNDENSIAITGYEYTKSSATYTIEFIGAAERNLEMDCVLSLTASDFYRTIDLKIKMAR